MLDGIPTVDTVDNLEVVDNQVELSLDQWYNLCYTRPDVFAHSYFPHILRAPSSDFHFLLYDLIIKINDTLDSNYFAIAAPRGNAKTQIMSIILPLWCVAFATKKFIVLISETGRLAEGNLEAIKHELLYNEKLREDFPHIMGANPTMWRKESIDTANDIRIIALGSGKQTRGHVKRGGIRPDLLLCHPAGTKILGVNNSIDVSQLKVGDKVYNHNWEEDEIVAWKPHVWEGDYYKFKLYGHPEEIEATAGHKFFVRKKSAKQTYVRTGNHMKCLDRGKWKRNQYRALYTYAEERKLNIREIEKGDMVGFGINTKTLSVEEIAKKEEWNLNENDWWIKTKEFWKLSGYFLGDGNLQGNRIRICSNKETEKSICDIVALFNVLKLNPQIVDCPTVLSIEVSSKILLNIFRAWKRDKNSHKVPTRSIEFLDPELQKELILGYIAADGWVSEDQGVRITSVCLELLEFMQRILFRQGIIASIRKGIKGGRVKIFNRMVNTQDKYDLYFKWDAWKIGLLPELEGVEYRNPKNWFIEDGTVWRKVERITSNYKTDTVYPFTVKNEHTYYNTISKSYQCDDLDSDELVRTKSRRDQHEDWFLKSVLGMAGAGQKMDAVVAGTIIHPHSLLAKMVSPDYFAGWEKYKYKAVIQPSKSSLWYTWEKMYINATNNNRRIEARKFFEENEEEMMDGVEVLWPEGDGYYHLMEFKINKGVRAFASEKMNNPVDPSTTLFDYTKIQTFNLDEINLKELDIYGAIDPASGDAKLKGDLAAIVTIGKDRKTGIKYVLDVKADESTPSACIEYIKIMHEEYNYKKFGVDSDSLKLFKDFIQKEIPDLSLTLYDLRLQKRKRIDRLEPPMHNGNIRIQENQTELIEELTFYPKSEHDDVLDALEIAVRLTGHKGYRLLTYR